MLYVFGKGIEFPFNLSIGQAHLSRTVSLSGLTKRQILQVSSKCFFDSHLILGNWQHVSKCSSSYPPSFTSLLKWDYVQNYIWDYVKNEFGIMCKNEFGILRKFRCVFGIILPAPNLISKIHKPAKNEVLRIICIPRCI